jgi:N-acetylglucosaminyldiphosphoundecaprenol N-acetyl-beta-D-mannosaminyltransferase
VNGSGQSPRDASRSDRTWAGVRLSRLDRRAFLQLVGRALDRQPPEPAGRTPLMVSFLNPFYARATHADRDLARLVDGFDVVQPDGWGVVYGARLAGVAVPERVAIEDVERSLFEQMAARGQSVFLFGSAPGVPERAAAVLLEHFPGLRVAGVRHGWIDVEAGTPGVLPPAAAEVAAQAADSGADLVLVGLPTPLQQQWAHRYGRRLPAAVVMTAGAYFDKLAEGLDWYPRWMLAARLGWLYRVWREPRRLLGRYTLGAVGFARLVLAELAGAGGGSSDGSDGREPGRSETGGTR